MSTVDTKALRALLSDYRRALIERDAASACKREGDMLEASHRAADAAKAMLNAAPALLDAADERDELRDQVAALEDVLAATHDDRDAMRAEMTRTIVCPLCKGEFVGQTGHLCPSAQTVGARKDALVVVHPNGPKQPGQDADAHRKLAERHLETITERDALRAELDEWRDPLSARRQELVEEIVMDVGDGQRSEVDLRDAQLAQAEAQIAALRAECERLREAAHAVCESTDASTVQLGLKMLRTALAAQEPRADAICAAHERREAERG